MNRKTLALAALSASLLLGVSAEASFARPHGLGGMPREVMYVRLLKQFDADKDGKVTKDEIKTGREALFAAIDTDKNGSLTPGELRVYRQEKMKARRAEQEKAGASENKPDDMAMAPDEDGPDGKGAEGKPRHHGKHGNRDMRHGMHHGGPAAMIMHVVDKDENGQVNAQEAEAAADRLFARLDRNNDGVISIDDMPNR